MALSGERDRPRADSLLRPSNLEDAFLKLTGSELNARCVNRCLKPWRLSLHIVRRNWRVYRKDFLANISPTLADPAFLILSLGLGLGGFMTIRSTDGATSST